MYVWISLFLDNFNSFIIVYACLSPQEIKQHNILTTAWKLIFAVISSKSIACLENIESRTKSLVKRYVSFFASSTFTSPNPFEPVYLLCIKSEIIASGRFLLFTSSVVALDSSVTWFALNFMLQYYFQLHIATIKLWYHLRDKEWTVISFIKSKTE